MNSDVATLTVVVPAPLVRRAVIHLKQDPSFMMTTARAEEVWPLLSRWTGYVIAFHPQVGFYTYVRDDVEAVEFTLKNS